MVIFKLLSSKALSASHSREGGGGTGKQKLLHKCFSQTLHNYTSIHRPTVTSVAHSLPLSLPHPHTHTTHHTHTLTQSKSGSYELIRFVEVEEIGFKSRLEGVGICNIYNAQWQ